MAEAISNVVEELMVNVRGMIESKLGQFRSRDRRVTAPHVPLDSTLTSTTVRWADVAGRTRSNTVQGNVLDAQQFPPLGRPLGKRSASRRTQPAVRNVEPQQ